MRIQNDIIESPICKSHVQFIVFSMHAIQESGVDIRKLEYLKSRIFGPPTYVGPALKTITVQDFKSLLQFSLSMPQSKNFIVEDMIEII